MRTIVPSETIEYMHESTLDALQQMRPSLRKRWEVLLRAEPVRSPLAAPESLVFLMDWTLNALFNALRSANARRRSKIRAGTDEIDVLACACECGLNPLLAYFMTAEKTLVEALFLADSPLPPMTAGERQACVTEIQLALHAIGRREIETFCALCQKRPCAHLKTAAVASAG
jgi:hypothetical protein